MGTLDSELSSKENIDSATGFSNLLRAHEVAANFPVFSDRPLSLLAVSRSTKKETSYHYRCSGITKTLDFESDKEVRRQFLYNVIPLCASESSCRLYVLSRPRDDRSRASIN